MQPFLFLFAANTKNTSNPLKILRRVALSGALFFTFVHSTAHLYAETVSGGGYTVQQIIAPLQGGLSGGGYTLTQTSQIQGDLTQGGGFSLFSPFATSTYVPSTSTPPTTGSGGGGGGYYILPILPTQNATSTATSSPPLSKDTILTANGSTCSTRIIFSGPIDVGVTTNKVEDVKKLERFLNSYENEKLPVNGIYEKRDIDAVKRWQKKYRTFILDPMRLKNPTGTVYTLSQRQIERQTTKNCGEAITVSSCPFFRKDIVLGDKGEEVRKVQQFLNIVQGEKLGLNGVFGPAMKEAVKRFQRSKKIYVFTFIPLHLVTGNWYTASQMKANETIGCAKLK